MLIKVFIFQYIIKPFSGYVWRIEPLSNQTNLFLTADGHPEGDQSIKLWDITKKKQLSTFKSNIGI